MITAEPKKLGFPYLVDIGITSQCPYQCSFCYANSSINGSFCDLSFIEHLSTILYKNKVMEVVLGGNGEPTLHPNFLEIIKIFNKKKFRLSFTTKNYSFFSSDLYKKIEPLVGSIAVSCNSLEDFNKFLSNYNASNSVAYYNKITIQLILGLNPFNKTLKLIKEIVTNKKDRLFHSRKVTLLGYKNLGRGSEFTPYEIPSNWLKKLKKIYLTLGVDSYIIQKYKEDLIKFGIDDTYLLSREGLNTCYIDAITQQVYKSSFEPSGFKLTDNFNKQDFLTIFSKL